MTDVQIVVTALYYKLMSYTGEGTGRQAYIFSGGHKDDPQYGLWMLRDAAMYVMAHAGAAYRQEVHDWWKECEAAWEAEEIKSKSQSSSAGPSSSYQPQHKD